MNNLFANLFSNYELSILLPCRNFAEFMTFYYSFLHTCSDFSKLELLLKIDDFEESKKYAKFLDNLGVGHKILVYSACNGRFSLHHFANDLSAISSSPLIWPVATDLKWVFGDWLACILEKKEEMERRFKDRVYCIELPIKNEEGRYLTIGKQAIVSRRWISLLGCLTVYPDLDRWLFAVNKAIDRSSMVDSEKMCLVYPNGKSYLHKHDRKKYLPPLVKKAKKRLKEIESHCIW